MVIVNKIAQFLSREIQYIFLILYKDSMMCFHCSVTLYIFWKQRPVKILIASIEISVNSFLKRAYSISLIASFVKLHCLLGDKSFCCPSFLQGFILYPIPFELRSRIPLRLFYEPRFVLVCKSCSSPLAIQWFFLQWFPEQ